VQRRQGKYAFVLPRFGEGVAGGAETLAGSLALNLSKRGDQVEVWTTCAFDNRTWENHFPPGESVEYGVAVKRFAVSPRDLESWVPKQIKISGGEALTLDDQFEWLAHGVNSSDLYAYIVANAERMDAMFFAPYLFATTFWGSLIYPNKSVLIPCLHDEHYAYSAAVSSMFRQVRGALFNAYPEMELARGLYGPLAGGEVGMGFEPHSAEYLCGLKPYFDEPFPYILYLGRKETGKNAHLLIDYFMMLKSTSGCPQELKLVIVGAGSFEDLLRPRAKERTDIVDLAHAGEEEKRRLVKHALYLCQPSLNESFSIVIMEAWLLGAPVVVHARCPVTRYHVLESGGGLYFGSFNDFEAVTLELLRNKALANDLAVAGLEYVKRRYNWAEVLRRFDAAMRELRLQ
jgi:glycosyltransferase involved in cell wall biosynthesis